MQICAKFRKTAAIFQELDDLYFKMWIGLPFFVDLRPIDDSDLVKNYFIEMRTMQMIKDKINSKSLKEYCCSLAQAYPRLEKRSMAALTLFATTYLCEQGRLVYGAVGLQHPKSILLMTFDINEKSFFILYL